MKRLWVRLSLMIGGVLFLVFFIQFLSIILEPAPPAGPTANLTTPGGAPEPPEAPPAEIARRLFEWMTFSTLVGIAGGWSLPGW